MARVQVSDETWTAFRTALGSKPVSAALGELVEREVGRQRRLSAGDAESVRLALADARGLANELQLLINRLERASGTTITKAGVPGPEQTSLLEAGNPD